MQEFATKLGAVNLSGQLDREETPQMREILIACMSAFLKSDNFPGKRQYVARVNG